MKLPSLSLRYFYKLAANFVSAIINLFILFYIPKLLGPINYGIFTYLQQSFTQVVTFMDLSVSSAVFVKISTNNKRLAFLKFISVYILLIFVILIIIGIFISVFFLPQGISADGVTKNLIFLGIALAFSNYLLLNVSGILDAFGQTILLEKIRIFIRLFLFSGLIIFLYFEMINIYSFFVYQILTFAVIAICAITLFLRNYEINIFRGVLRSKIIGQNIVKEIYDFSSPLVVHTLLGSIIVIFDLWLLKYVSGTAQVGFYGISIAISQIPMFLISPLVPLITREFASLNKSKLINNMRKIFENYILPSFALILFIVFTGVAYSELTILFLGELYINALAAITIAMFYPYCQTVSQLSVGILISVDETRTIRNITIYGAIFGIPLSLALLFYLELGALGLILKILLVNIFVLSLQLFKVSLVIKKSFISIIKVQLKSLFSIAAIVFICRYFATNLSSHIIISFVIGVTLSLILIIFVITIFPKLIGLEQLNLSNFLNKFYYNRSNE